MAKKAVEYIDTRARDGRPFFLYQPLSIPHKPHMPTKDFEGKSGQGTYGDWIFESDWVVGQIVEALRRNGFAESTLLIVSSDNGAEGHEYPALRGSKRSIYEGGHREPFVARWPGKIKLGTVCDYAVCLNDLMARCTEIAGAKVPDNAREDSISILPHLLGTSRGASPRGHGAPVDGRRPGHPPGPVETHLPQERGPRTLQPQGRPQRD